MTQLGNNFWYNFNEFKDAFLRYYSLQESHRFVISVNIFTSGYWVEDKINERGDLADKLYETPEDVRALEIRVIKETKNGKFTPGLIT